MLYIPWRSRWTVCSLAAKICYHAFTGMPCSSSCARSTASTSPFFPLPTASSTLIPMWLYLYIIWQSSVEDEMGSLQRQVAPGNIFVRRLSASGGLAGQNGSRLGGSPRQSPRQSPKQSPKGSPSGSLSRGTEPGGSPARRRSSGQSSGLVDQMAILGRKETPIYLP